jgi:hypothetical protein
MPEPIAIELGMYEGKSIIIRDAVVFVFLLAALSNFLGQTLILLERLHQSI